MFAYYGLHKKLHEIFGKNLSLEFMNLERNFALMVVVYVFFSVYMFVMGSYCKIIEKIYIRWIMTNCFGVAFEAAIITSMMYLHYH
jgi:hypothetical protein